MIITQAKVIAIPLLIAGIVTTGAVIGTAQQPATPKPSVSVTRTTQRTEYADRKVVGEGVSKTVGAAAPDPQNAETRPAMQLLAEEGRADQEMFDFLTADNRDVRRDDTQMLKRLSLRMLAVARELGADHAARRAAYAAHRDRMKKLVDWTKPADGDDRRLVSPNANTEVEAYLKEAEEMLERETKDETAAASGKTGAKTTQSKGSTTKAAGAGGRGQRGGGGMMMMGMGGGFGAGMGGIGGGMGGTAQASSWESQVEFQNRVEIAQLSAVLAAQGTNPKDEVAFRRLDLPMELSFARPTPLKDVLARIRRSLIGSKGNATVPVFVDPQGLAEAKVTLDTLVSLDLEGIPFKTALRLMLKQLGLAYCVRDGVLIISSLQGIREELAEAAGELRGKDPEQMDRIMQSMGGGMMGGGMR